MGKTFNRVLHDIRAADPLGKQTHLILALTDGEANDKDVFNRKLDEIQDELWGDVQVCLMGLSLEPEDIAWFEDEECDDTRIRTIEPWEVEQQQILWRQVIGSPQEYNFSMHTMRALVTNLFPADYDCEAPLQTLRHRLYITLHAIDRRVTGRRDTVYAGDAAMDDCCGCLIGLFSGKAQKRRLICEEELEDEDEDIESQIIDLLSELSALRAEARQQQQHESDASLQKIPYPQLESGFLPSDFMPMQSWLMPPGRAETGKWACAMAPRPGVSSMEPLDIVFGEAGVTLEVKPRTDECSSELERKRASKAKAVFRRRPGRSRSPLVSMDEIHERGASEDRPRGRPRFWTHG